MFLRRSEPVLLTEEGLEGLCASLNRPVVDVEGLPVGPARSAIALVGRPDGSRGLLVALRSEDSGTVATYEFEGELSADPQRALDAGLSFAEGMGFLFDEDMLASGAPARRREALEHWCRLTGDELPGAAPLVPEPLLPVSEGPEIAGGDGSLALHDLVDALDDALDDDLDHDLHHELDHELDTAIDMDDVLGAHEELDLAEQAPAPSEAAVLSKFRRVEAPADADAAPAGGGAELARIPILRRRKPAEAETPPLLTRLLARF